MLNVRLAGGHLYEKQLFTWLSLVVSLMVSFCAVLFVPRRKSKGTIVLGSSVRSSVSIIMPPQLLLQFSRDFDEAFQLLFP